MCFGGPPEPKDMRLPQEQARDVNKARADQERLDMFRGYQGQEDLGYGASGRGEAIRQPFERVIGDLPEEYSNIYANAGFGPKRVGPQAAGLGRETTELRTRQAEQESASVANWRNYVNSFGDTPLSVGGPVVAQPQGGGGGIGGALGGLIGTLGGSLIPEIGGLFGGGGGKKSTVGQPSGTPFST